MYWEGIRTWLWPQSAKLLCCNWAQSAIISRPKGKSGGADSYLVTAASIASKTYVERPNSHHGEKTTQSWDLWLVNYCAKLKAKNRGWLHCKNCNQKFWRPKPFPSKCQKRSTLVCKTKYILLGNPFIRFNTQNHHKFGHMSINKSNIYFK